MDIREVEARLEMSGDDFDPCAFYGCTECANVRPDKRLCYRDMLDDIFDAVDDAYGKGGCDD